MGFKPDIVVDLTFPVMKPKELVIRTNAKREAIAEVLETWAHSQIGTGTENDGKPILRSTYRIKIGLRLEDDAFGVESDTGNESVTLGIVCTALGALREGGGTILGLDESSAERGV